MSETILSRVFDTVFTSRKRRLNENQRMLVQFVDNLETTLSRVDRDSLPEDKQGFYDEAKATVQALRKSAGWSATSWEAAYRLEKMLVFLRDPISLKIELTRQLDFLKGARPRSYEFYKESGLLGVVEEQPSSEGHPLNDPVVQQQQALLERIFNDLHWNYAQRHLNRQALNDYTRRATFMALFLAVAFLAVLSTMHATQDSLTFLTGYAGLVLALAAGVVGSTFSVITSPPPSPTALSLEEMRRRTDFSVLFLRLTVGGLAATILYFFFETGVLTGGPVPQLAYLGFRDVEVLGDAEGSLREALALLEVTKPGLLPQTLASAEGQDKLATALSEALPRDKAEGPLFAGRTAGSFVPNADLSKLLIWSFAAGFSEKLVSGMLGRIGQDKA